MHLIKALCLLLLSAKQSASLVASNMPRSNAINQGVPQIIRPANLIQIQAENQTGPPTTGTYHDIGSNLTIYIILGDTAPAQAVYELLLLAKEQIHDRAAHFGPTNLVPRRQKRPDLTQTIRAGLVYYVQPSRIFNPRRPGLAWGEFEVATSWLFEHRFQYMNHRQCNFLLFGRISPLTGQELNLGFGAIELLNSTMTVKTVQSGAMKLPSDLVS